MAGTEQRRLVRMKLPCRDREHFLAEFASKMAARIFVPFDAPPPPPGTLISLNIAFQDHVVHVKGTASVVKHVHTPREGAHVRFVSLDSDSVQFSLGPQQETAVTAAPAAPPPESDVEDSTAVMSLHTLTGLLQHPTVKPAEPTPTAFPDTVTAVAPYTKKLAEAATAPPPKPSSPRLSPAKAEAPASETKTDAAISLPGPRPSGPPRAWSDPPPAKPSAPTAGMAAPLMPAPPSPSAPIFPPRASPLGRPFSAAEPAPKHVPSSVEGTPMPARSPLLNPPAPEPPSLPDFSSLFRPAESLPPHPPTSSDATPVVSETRPPSAPSLRPVPAERPMPELFSVPTEPASSSAAPPLPLHDTTRVIEAPARLPDAGPELDRLPPPRRRWLVVASVVGFVVVGGGALVALRSSSAPKETRPDDTALVGELEKVDARISLGRLAAPGGDAALDHLRAAVNAAPADPRVKERQTRLATVFEQRVKEAIARGDDAEAAVQLQALFLTDPQRPGVQQQLSDAEDRVRHRPKK